MKLIIIFTSSLLITAAQLSPAICSEPPPEAQLLIQQQQPQQQQLPQQSCPVPAVDTTGEMDYVMKHIRKAVTTFKVDTSHANLHVDDTAINSYGSILATGPSCSTIHSHSHNHLPPLTPHHLINHPITRTSFSVELRNVSVTAQLTFNAFFQKFHGSYESRFAAIRLSGYIEADLLEQRLELDSFRIERKIIERENYHFKGVPDFVMTAVLDLIQDDIDILYDKLIKAIMKKALKSFRNEAHFHAMGRRFSVRI